MALDTAGLVVGHVERVEMRGGCLILSVRLDGCRRISEHARIEPLKRCSLFQRPLFCWAATVNAEIAAGWTIVPTYPLVRPDIAGRPATPPSKDHPGEYIRRIVRAFSHSARILTRFAR